VSSVCEVPESYCGLVIMTRVKFFCLQPNTSQGSYKRLQLHFLTYEHLITYLMLHNLLINKRITFMLAYDCRYLVNSEIFTLVQ
jgi:hypothetical protein